MKTQEDGDYNLPETRDQGIPIDVLLVFGAIVGLILLAAAVIAMSTVLWLVLS